MKNYFDYFATSNDIGYFQTNNIIRDIKSRRGSSQEIKIYTGHTKEMYEQENIDYDLSHPQIMNESLRKIYTIGDYSNETLKIPTITHQIYFSFDDRTNPIISSSITKTINTISRLNSQSDFCHYIWTNKEEIIPESIKSLKGVEIHLVQELEQTRLFPELNLYLTQALVGQDKGKMSMSSDVLRSLVVREFGGIYRDFDYEVFDADLLYKYMKSFNFIGGIEFVEKYSFVGSAFFAASPNHNIMSIEADIIERNIHSHSDTPEYIKFPHSKFEKAIYTAGPTAITMAFYKGYDLGSNVDILLPPKVLFNFEYAWSLTPDSKCYHRLDEDNPPKLFNEYNGYLLKTIGADMFCGDWPETKGYSSPIKYLNYDNDLEIVVARYNEDLSWLDSFKDYKVTVYNKGNEDLNLSPNCQIINLENIGREAHTYLYHVITSYETLAGRTIFLQGNPFDHNPDFDSMIESSNSLCKNIIAQCSKYKLGIESDIKASIQWNNTKWSDTILSDESMIAFAQNNFNSSLSEDSDIYFQYGAQFAVEKENIICNNIEYHKSLYDYFLVKSPIEGHYIENLWDEWASCH